MAKESSSTRIPRLDGVGSRIPLPGSLRSSTVSSGRPSQILRPSSAMFAQHRPASLSGLRPPVPASLSGLRAPAGGGAIKRSCSGERLHNAVGLVTKKTTAAFKKFIGVKPERPSLMQKPPEKIAGKAAATSSSSSSASSPLVTSTPRPNLTRSETFVRGDSQMEIDRTTTETNVGGATQLVGASTRQMLYTTRSLDATHAVAALDDTMTMTSEEHEKDRTLGGTMTVNMHGRTFEAPNLTRTFNATQVLGKTLYMSSPTEHVKKHVENTITLSAPTKRQGGQVPELASPISNATFSNPCSTENLTMLDDVSLPCDFEADETLKQQAEFGETQHNIYSDRKGVAMKLPMNSTMNTERLLDLTSNGDSPASQLQLLNLTKEMMMDTPPNHNSTQLLYMTQISSAASTIPDRITKFGRGSAMPYQHTPRPVHALSSLLLKGTQSDLVLPTRTPDEDLLMGVDGENPNPKQKEHVKKQADTTITTNASAKRKGSQIPELASPISNATFSNPCSNENLTMLEDVSLPCDFEGDDTLQQVEELGQTQHNIQPYRKDDDAVETQRAQAPDKAKMKLALNSTINFERLLDLTANVDSPRHMQLLNLTKELMMDTQPNQLLYMTQISSSASTTPDRLPKFGKAGAMPYQRTSHPAHVMSPLLLKGAQSELVLPTRTPDDDLLLDMDADQAGQKQKTRFSFGLDLTDSTLDCSIELVDVSLSSTALSQPNTSSMQGGHAGPHSPSSQQLQLQTQVLRKQNSFDLDESLGILTPDQMKEFLDSPNTNTNHLELPLVLTAAGGHVHKMSLQQMRIDQTPSPEELPLDPVEVKTDISDAVLSQQQQQHAAFSAAQQRQYMQQQQHLQSSSASNEPVSQHTDTEVSKADPMSKSNVSSVSKISTSFITSVTSVTSLDTGYQGDGEMSRPASRGACDHSPSNAPAARKGGGHVSRQPSFNQQQQQLAQQHHLPPIRRQDPMTDSDFFTESDADDIFHRGDRRAQVIDGQLYGPMLQPSTSVFISEDPQMEDSCMESSGIFTDVENRCDEDLAQMRRQETQEPVDMSPDGDGEGDDSTETVKSNRGNGRADGAGAGTSGDTSNGNGATLQAGQLSSSQTSSTIQSSLSTDRLSAFSNRTSYCSVDGSAVNVDGKSFASLEEAFAECLPAGEASSLASANRAKSSSTTGSAAIGASDHHQPHSASVPRNASPRKHASLSSLCNNTNTSGNNSNNNSGAINKKSRASSPVLNNNVAHAAATRSESKVSLNSDGASAKSAGSPRSRVPAGGVKGAKPSPAGGSGSGVALQPRKTINKWDAVMNKIESNKPLMKKNFNDVKSRVSTTRVLVTGAGGGRAATATSSASVSPTMRRSPSSVSGSSGGPRASKVSSSAGKTSAAPSPPNGLQSPQTKRLLQNAAASKRGRSYSKDSPKSSQSDLSLTIGSPKLLAKTPLRAAKKRDVRNLSISPTDLGPPPKTQQTVNGAATRPKPSALAITERRFNINAGLNINSGHSSAISSAASTPTGSGSGSGPGSSVKTPQTKSAPPPVKKTNFIPKRFEVKPSTAPLREHNRLGGSHQQPSTAAAAAAAATAKNGSKPEAAVESQAIRNGGVHHVANNNNHTSGATGTATTAQAARTRSPSTSPVLAHHGRKAATGPAPQPDKKPQSKVQATRKMLFHRPQPARAAPEVPESLPPADTVELRELKLLNRHSCNGRLDYQALERHLQETERDRNHQQKGVEAFGVLLQYLIYDLDAFSCPAAKRESTTAKESLSKTLLLLDEAKIACTDLQDQLCDKEAYYMQREDELQALHRCEMEKAKIHLAECEIIAKQRIAELERKLANKDAENRRALDSYQHEMDNKLGQKETQLSRAAQQTLAHSERIHALECTEQELKAKLSLTESSSSVRLQAAAEREQELRERIKVLSQELQETREVKEHRERELRDKLHLSHDEISVLRTTRRSLNDSQERCGSPRKTNSVNAAAMEINRLQSEAESLSFVVEMKQKDIAKLTKQNEELMRDAKQQTAMQAKISLLESRNELLKSELVIKSQKEKELLRQIDDMQKAHTYESAKRTRLSYDNEALQWHLKQRSEQLHLVEAKLQQLSANESTLNGTLHTSPTMVNRSSLQNGMSHMEDVSPPTSPIVKAVIEKPDSVSWVLEMDDETPEAAASKMVRRAGSFRSVERSPSMRRQLSVSASAACTAPSSANGSPGPNPLSQSMSAASVIRQHSSEQVPEFSNRSHSRSRSKSVSIKSPELTVAAAAAPVAPTTTKNGKKLMRQSAARKHELAPPTWNDSSFTCSSPYSGMRPRTSTMCVEDACGEAADEVLFRHAPAPTAARKLITCDTSALNRGERLEMRSLPTHPSVHDLKVLKKCHEIQESAGEAMVSGTNSEDEGCSASSDEIVCSASTSSSATSGSTSSLHQMKNSHMSLEEVLQIEKIHSLNGTPMEMSWSDDADIFTNTSTV